MANPSARIVQRWRWPVVALFAAAAVLAAASAVVNQSAPTALGSALALGAALNAGIAPARTSRSRQAATWAAAGAALIVLLTQH